MARHPSRNQTTLKNSNVLRRLAHLKKQKAQVAFAGVRKGADYVDETPMAKILYILEHGADFTHPGGTAYKIVNGRAVFVPNSDPEAANLPRTGPHRIVIPPRPVLRYTAATRSKIWSRQFAALMKREGVSAEQALANIADLMRGDIQNTIASATGTFADNAPSTIKKKKINAPLRDSRKLWQAIDWEVTDQPGEYNIKAGGA